MVSVLVPISYLVFLFGSLAVFSRYYRRAQNKKVPVAPWFPHHKTRDIYISLLSLDPPPPRPVLVAALLRRAMADVRLIWSIRDAKTSLTTLLGKGQIGDDLWERFLNAEKELEAEILEVVGEANTFQEGYGQQIFGIASEMVSHERWKEIYEGIGKKREEEKAKMASPNPSTVLSPSPYLTPSSLSLSLSNPLVNPPAGAAANDDSKALEAPTPEPTSSLPTPAPSTPSTPQPRRTPSPAAAIQPASDGEEEQEDDDIDSAPIGAPTLAPPVAGGSGASSPAKSQPGTPGSAKKGKMILKKKVKGGR